MLDGLSQTLLVMWWPGVRICFVLCLWVVPFMLVSVCASAVHFMPPSFWQDVVGNILARTVGAATPMSGPQWHSIQPPMPRLAWGGAPVRQVAEWWPLVQLLGVPLATTLVAMLEFTRMSE